MSTSSPYSPRPAGSSWRTTEMTIEMLARRDLYGQTYDEIASALGRTRAQVYFAISEMTSYSSDDPRIAKRLAEERERVMLKLAAELGEPPAEAPGPRGPGRPRKTSELSPEQVAAIEEEVIGCIDLVRQAAAQFGITPRNFLHRCITHARSMC